MTKKELITLLENVNDDDRIFVLDKHNEEIDYRLIGIDITKDAGYIHLVIAEQE